MPDRHHTFVRDEVLPSWWANAIQAALSTLAENFRLERVAGSDVQVQVPAGPGDGLVAIAVEGKWRFVEASVVRAHPGGAAGAYDVFVTTADNDIVNAPLPNTDITNYAFDLAIVPAGGSPALVPGVVDFVRKVGSLQWDGAKVTLLSQSVGDTSDAPGDFTVGGVLSVGGDGTIYGAAAGKLRTSGGWQAVNELTANIAGAGQVQVGDGGQARVSFGAAADARIYRTGPAALATDSAFTVAGQLNANANAVFLPATSASVPVTVQGRAGQTQPLQMWLSSAPATVAQIDNAGLITLAGGIQLTPLGETWYRQNFSSSAWTVGPGNAIGDTKLQRVGAGALQVIGVNGATATTFSVQALAGQVPNVQEWRDSTGAMKSAIGPVGDRLLTSFVRSPDNAGGYINFLNSPGAATAVPAAATTVGFIVQGRPSQVGNLQEWQDNTGAALSKIANNGSLQIVAPVANTMGSGGTAYGSTVLSIGTAAAASKGLVIRGVASQSANLQEWQDNTGTALAYVSQTGSFWTTDRLAAGGGWLSSVRASLYTGATTWKGLVIQGVAAQSANLQEWQDNTGLALASVGSNGWLNSARLVASGPAGNGVFEGYVTGEAFSRLKFYNTSLQFGGGAANQDAQLDRPVAGMLRVAGVNAATSTTFVVKGIAAQTGDLFQAQDSTTAVLSRFKSDGTLAVGTITAGAGGGGGFPGTWVDPLGKVVAVRTATTGVVFTSSITTSTSNIFSITADGTMGWGAGAGAATDTNLYRSAAGTLKTDSELQGALDIHARVGGTTWVALGARGPASEAAIAFGPSLAEKIYRSGTGALKTGATFWANYLYADAEVYGRVNGAQQVKIGYVTGNAGITFGSAEDASIWRTGAKNLQSDSTLTAHALRGDLNGSYTPAANAGGGIVVTLPVSFSANKPGVYLMTVSLYSGELMREHTFLIHSLNWNVNATWTQLATSGWRQDGGDPTVASVTLARGDGTGGGANQSVSTANGSTGNQVQIAFNYGGIGVTGRLMAWNVLSIGDLGV